MVKIKDSFNWFKKEKQWKEKFINLEFIFMAQNDKK